MYFTVANTVDTYFHRNDCVRLIQIFNFDHFSEDEP